MEIENISGYLSQLIFPSLLAIPSILVILAGIVFGIFRYKNFKKVSLISIAVLIILLFLRVVFIFNPLLITWLIRSGADSTTISYTIGAIGVVSSLVDAISLGLLIFAVWYQRTSD